MGRGGEWERRQPRAVCLLRCVVSPSPHRPLSPSELIRIPPRQERLDRVGVEGDVANAAAEFVGIDFSSGVVFDDDKVRLAVDVADGNAAVWLGGVAA